jgi:DNA-binding GntR family transcriptional regulator
MSDDSFQFATAQQQSYRFLRDRILRGELPGGVRINPASIAQMLGISRMPVREALRQLDAEGLVTMPPNRGAVVTQLTPADVEELFEMRAVLEALSMRFAMPHMTSQAFAELAALKDRMLRAREDIAVWLKRHDEFHQFICEVSRRPRLAREIARLRQAVHPYLAMYFNVYGTLEMEGFEHDTLLAAIGSGSPARAERAMRDHVRKASTDLIAFLKEREAMPHARRSSA